MGDYETVSRAPDPESFADLFADFFYKAILQAGGSKYTAHLCVAEWYRAALAEEPSEPRSV